MLPKDTFYSNNGELQTEICFGKMRWSDIDNEEPEDKYDIFEPATSTLDMSKKRATDMRANQRVKLVEPDPNDEKEIKPDNLKIAIMETYDKYIAENCNNKGEIMYHTGNEIKNPIKVLNSIKEEVVQKKIIATETDKTSRISQLVLKEI